MTVVTTLPLRDSSVENLTEIDLSFSYELVFDANNMAEILAKETNLLVLLSKVHTVAYNLSIEQLKHELVQELINNDSEFDLVIVESSSLAWYAFSHRFNCPIVGFSSMPAGVAVQDSFGNPSHAYLYPDVNLPFGEYLTVLDTTVSVLYTFLVRTIEVFAVKYFHELSQLYIDENAPSPGEIERNISVLLVNTIPGFHKNKPVLPTYVELHGLHLKPKRTLPKVRISN